MTMKKTLTLLFLSFITSLVMAQDPIAKINIPSTIWCEGKSVVMNNQSLNANKYVWYYGDGDTSQRRKTNHIYTQGSVLDSFVVSLVAIDSISGKKDSVSKKIFIQKKATADFSFRAIAVVCFFYPKCENYLGVEWDFDDKSGTNYSDADSITHVFPKSGTYNVELLATTDFGCNDTMTREVVIVDSAGGSIGEANLYKMKMYPNPGTNQVLDFEVNSPEDLAINISDATGKVIYSLNKTYNAGTQRINVGEILNSKPNGLYFVSLNNHRATYVIKAYKTE